MMFIIIRNENGRHLNLSGFIYMDAPASFAMHQGKTIFEPEWRKKIGAHLK